MSILNAINSFQDQSEPILAMKLLLLFLFSGRKVRQAAAILNEKELSILSSLYVVISSNLQKSFLWLSGSHRI